MSESENRLCKRSGRRRPRDENEDLLEAAQALARVGWWVTDHRTGEGRWSRQARRNFGFDDDSPVDLSTVLRHVHPEDAEAVRKAGPALADRNVPFDVEHRIVRADGEIRWIHTKATAVRDGKGKAVRLIGAAQDITERKQAEASLRRSEAQYRRIIETASEGVWMIDAEARTVFVNGRMASLCGYAVDELLGRSVFEFMDADERLRMQAALLRSRGGLSREHELKLRRRDGSDLWVHLKGRSLFDAAGRYEGSVALMTDVTERRRVEAELRATEEQLRQAQKMEAIGSFAGSIAHDFNNLLSVIVGRASVADRALPPASPARQHLQAIDSAAQRAARLARQLLAFSRKQVSRRRRVDINQLVSNMEDMLRDLLGDGIEFVTLLGPEARSVNTNPNQIEQIVMNLAVNARDAMPEGGRLEIETSAFDLDTSAGTEVSLPAGPYAVLTFRDTGIGMDASTRARIFEPFFTTKGEKGSGLGLSIVLGIVRENGGGILVESEAGHGASFRVLLPAQP